MSPSEAIIGKIGRVTGVIAPNTLGEIIIPVRGGAEAYLARAASAEDTIPVGTQVQVEGYFPPRTVTVKPIQ